MTEAPLVGAIELGGTKIVLAVGHADGRIRRRATIPTEAPEQSLRAAAAFFQETGEPLAALGVGAFGPIVIDPAAPDHGRVLETNKPGWSGFDLAGALGRALGVPVALVTDVGAAAVGEASLGALRDDRLGIYLTVGTGIGGAVVCDGTILPALLHPEMGHVALTRRADDAAPSTCRFHASCAEGLVAGPAIGARFGQSLSHFAPGSAEHRLAADYLGQLCAGLVLTLSPHRIVLGGGVAQTPGLIPQIAGAMRHHLGGYVQGGALDPGFLRLPELGQDAGIVGALLCAGRAAPRA